MAQRQIARAIATNLEVLSIGHRKIVHIIKAGKRDNLVQGGRRQEAEGRRQEAEGRRQKAGGRRQSR
ncbi:MAG: hypothetical protein F6K41_25405 [Symploca sp. SIO3E6]|nr:hypothetical protein [Caldora sp. SIO3E6]